MTTPNFPLPTDGYTLNHPSKLYNTISPYYGNGSASALGSFRSSSRHMPRSALHFDLRVIFRFILRFYILHPRFGYSEVRFSEHVLTWLLAVSS
jgi:hypothetical protein